MLQSFLQSSSALPFDWVSCNCGFWACDWLRLSTGIDPVSQLRGRFRSAHEFRRHVEQLGGNEAFSRSIAKKARLIETNNPKPGDVGLVATGDGATMAINVGENKWAAKSLSGVTIAPFEHIVAWGV